MDTLGAYGQRGTRTPPHTPFTIVFLPPNPSVTQPGFWILKAAVGEVLKGMNTKSFKIPSGAGAYCDSRSEESQPRRDTARDLGHLACRFPWGGGPRLLKREVWGHGVC